MGFSNIDFDFNPKEVLKDYELALLSRECSYLVRKEVFAGRAKFGIYGDGKELCQIALGHHMRAGDYFAGYYRDQTVGVLIGDLEWSQYFAQLYGHPDIGFDPHSAGRQMINHHATRLLDRNGLFTNQTSQVNSVAGISSTGSQMPHTLGVAYASKYYREHTKELGSHQGKFFVDGREIGFCTIGDASTSEGMFFETINAASVLQVPMVISVWDDGYGISVPIKYQTAKESISKALAGFKRGEGLEGFEIIEVKAWDYPGLMEAYKKATEIARKEDVPCLVHVTECTQLQGHSSSGSHERYKDKERLDWEHEWDCNKKFKEWILEKGFSTEQELENMRLFAVAEAKRIQKKAYEDYTFAIQKEKKELLKVLKLVMESTHQKQRFQPIVKDLLKEPNPLYSDLVKAGRKALRLFRNYQGSTHINLLKNWLRNFEKENKERFSSHLYSESMESPLNIEGIMPIYQEDSPKVDGRDIINKGFHTFLKDPRVFVLGEDVGKIGDVNQTLANLQKNYGEWRVTDTGIRETTIVGQGIGAALRGLKPIVEIQYLDYIYYCLSILTDDVACMQYRTKGGQKAPLIIRTRGHRLEGIWHSGSPMGTLVNSLRGMHICVPRNMVQAVGMYRTLLEGDDPGLVIESLNSYRLKEYVPQNMDEYKIPLGVPEVLMEGKDISLVTYGSMCRIGMEAVGQLKEFGISAELIDVQTLLPFDRTGTVLKSIMKTNKVVFMDEDVPGGASAFMMQQVLDEQGGGKWLDLPAACISGMAHRPAYGSDGDYFSKPNVENIVDKVLEMMHEVDPDQFPLLY